MRRACTKAICACALASCTFSAPAVADAVRVSGDACGARVRVIAHHAKLSQVLARLGQAFHFRVSFAALHDPIVDFDVTGSLDQVVASITRERNASALRVLARRCGDGSRLVAFWVLTDSAANVGSEVATLAPAVAASSYDGNYLLIGGEGPLQR